MAKTYYIEMTKVENVNDFSKQLISKFENYLPDDYTCIHFIDDNRVETIIVIGAETGICVLILVDETIDKIRPDPDRLVGYEYIAGSRTLYALSNWHKNYQDIDLQSFPLNTFVVLPFVSHNDNLKLEYSIHHDCFICREKYSKIISNASKLENFFLSTIGDELQIDLTTDQIRRLCSEIMEIPLFEWTRNDPAEINNRSSFDGLPATVRILLESLEDRNDLFFTDHWTTGDGETFKYMCTGDNIAIMIHWLSNLKIFLCDTFYNLNIDKIDLEWEKLILEHLNKQNWKTLHSRYLWKSDKLQCIMRESFFTEAGQNQFNKFIDGYIKRAERFRNSMVIFCMDSPFYQGEWGEVPF